MRKARHGEPLRFVRSRALENNDPDVCVVWPYRTNTEGYGLVEVGGRVRLAHQVVLEHAGEPQPRRGLEVRHLCGVTSCVNRHHLKWGTRSENMRDRFRVHGDTMQGERKSRATWAEVA